MGVIDGIFKKPPKSSYLTPMDYLEKAKNPRVVVIDSDSNEIEMKIEKTERPVLCQLESLCNRKGLGKVTFYDECNTTITKTCTVHRMVLYYDDILISFREMPGIHMIAGDNIVVKFVFNIIVESHEGTIKYNLS